MNYKEKALHAAIGAGLQHSYTEDGKGVTNVDKLIEGAKKIEEYLNSNNEAVKNENI